ncbi:hypothetical protein ACLOJK_040235 [Asimina triloba]
MAEEISKTALLVIGMQVFREHDPLGRDVEIFRRHLYGGGKEGPATKGRLQTPNRVRQTVFDAVALDYQLVTVIADATATYNPNVHIAGCYPYGGRGGKL